MSVYITSTVISVFFAYLYTARQKKLLTSTQQKSIYIKSRSPDKSISILLLILSILPLILVYGLRYKVGTDYFYYFESFDWITRGGIGYFKDPIYNVLQFGVAFFTDNYIVFSLVCGFLFCSCFYYVIVKLSTSPAYSILLFVITNTYFISLNGVRQGLAMAVLMIAILHLIHEKQGLFYLFVLCAGMIHNSAYIFLPLYVISKIEVSPMRGWIIIAISGCVGILGKGALHYIVSLTPYAHYVTGSYSDSSFELILFLINIFIYIACCFYYGHAKDQRMFKILFWLQILAVSSLLLSSAIPLAKRFCWIFSLGQILLLPALTKYEKSKIGKFILNTGIVVCFTLSVYVGDYVNGAHHVFPYQIAVNQNDS